MKRSLNYIMLILLIATSVFANGQETIDKPKDIKNISVIAYRKVGNNWQQVDQESTFCRLRDKIRIQFAVEMNDGSVLYTDSPHKKGTLKFNQFKIKVRGAYGEGLVGSMAEGRDFFTVSSKEYNLIHDGRLKIVFEIAHKKAKERTFKTAISALPEFGNRIVMLFEGKDNVMNNINGIDPEVKVSTTIIDGRTFLKIEPEPYGECRNWRETIGGMYREDYYYLIDIKKEKALLSVIGSRGTFEGDNGGRGGNIIFYFTQEAVAYADLITVQNHGGNGAKGATIYEPDGENGERGEITVFVDGNEDNSIQINIKK